MFTANTMLMNIMAKTNPARICPGRRARERA